MINHAISFNEKNSQPPALMLIDAREIADGADHPCDVCIVGGGAAGLTIAHEFAWSGMAVTVVESGGVRRRSASEFRGIVADTTRHAPLHHYRESCLGGTTSQWGGGCVPFDPIDFDLRRYVPHSGWPFSATTMDPYYERAARHLEIGANEFTVAEALPNAPPFIADMHDADIITDRLQRFSKPTHFGRSMHQLLREAPDIQVLLHATCIDVQLNESHNFVTSIRCVSRRGQFTVRARTVVLAAGGLETTRLLLNSGVGNDNVGRFYMCHLTGVAGSACFSRPPVTGYYYTRDGIYCARRLLLSAEAQRRLEVLNVMFRLHHHGDFDDPVHGNAVMSMMFFVKDILMRQRRRKPSPPPLTARMVYRHLANVVRDPRALARFSKHWLQRRILCDRKLPSVVLPSAVHDFVFISEQEPNPASRVTLTADRDHLGMRRLLVDWRATDFDIASVRHSFDYIVAEMRRRGVLRTATAYDGTRWEAMGGHHLGTTRMADPRQGVVDANCRVHGVANLFIAGGSVFPTSSQANPTMMLVALAIRLADHLREAHKKGARPVPRSLYSTV